MVVSEEEDEFTEVACHVAVCSFAGVSGDVGGEK